MPSGVTVTPHVHSGVMTFVNVGTIGSIPGKRDLLVEILTRRSSDLERAGCLLYEVGINRAARHGVRRGAVDIR